MTSGVAAVLAWVIAGCALVGYGAWEHRAVRQLRARLRPELHRTAGSRHVERIRGSVRGDVLAAMAAALVATALFGPWAGLASGSAAGLGVFALRRTAARRHQERLAQALPEFFSAVAAGLRAGGALSPVVALVAKDTPEPLGSRLREALARQAVGLRLDEVFEDLGVTLRLPPFRVLAAALRMQRRTGVQLAPLLDSLVAALRDRERLDREVRALSAQGRASMVVLVGLPLVLAGLLTVVDPRYLAPLVTTPLGRVMLAYALASVAVGLWVVRRLVANI